MVDVSHLNAGVRHVTVALLGQAAAAYDISPIVALSLYEAPAVYAEARQAAAAGILRLALRVDYGELEKDDADLGDMALDSLDAAPGEVHLLTDYGVIDANLNTTQVYLRMTGAELHDAVQAAEVRDFLRATRRVDDVASLSNGRTGHSL